MQRSILLWIFFTILICTGCEVFENEQGPSPDLFGEWYKVESVQSDIPSPDKRIYGWRIQREENWRESALGSFHPIGIKGEEGEISLINTRYVTDIESLEGSTMVVGYFAHPELVNDTVRYHFSGDKLVLDGRYYKGTFTKTKLGEQVTEPVSSSLNVIIDEEPEENLKVAERTPTAYMSKISEDKIRLYASLGSQKLIIYIDDFEGPGTYTISKEQAFHYRFGTDWIEPSYITQADSSGYITIEEYDLQTNRCAGTFTFDALREGLEENENDNPLYKRSFSEGSFDVPVYTQN